MVDAPPRSALDRGLRWSLYLSGAATVSPLTILLFWRAETAARLDLVGTIVGEATIIGAVAAFAVSVLPRARGFLPAGSTLVVGGAVSAFGLGLMAWTIESSLFAVGGVMLAVGVGPAIVLPRVLLSITEREANRFRTLSLYWCAVSLGAAWPLVTRMISDPAESSLYWGCCALMAVAAVAMAPHIGSHDSDVETELVVHRLDVPWIRRSVAAALAAGVVVVGGANPALSLLVGEWQRGPSQTAAVLAAAPCAALVIGLVGPWYHSLDRLRGGRRADAIGIQLAAGGLLVFIGGLSFTYIGLIVSWLVAGGSLVLAAAGLDAATFPAVPPSLRRQVGVRQVWAFALGGVSASILSSSFLGSFSDQWKVALAGLPLLVVGLVVRHNAEPPRVTAPVATAAAAATIPRRVNPADDAASPRLTVERLDVAYGTVQVLFDVDLDVNRGEVVALLGTNGAGKTTLLRAISGLEPVLGGRITLAGLDITRTRPTWRVGMGLHQIVGGEAVVPSLTVHENLRLFGHGVPPAQREEGIAEAYELFPRLAERDAQHAATLSGGEKQMLALAKAPIVRPRLLMIDEFSLGLAPLIVGELLPVVRAIADGGASVLLVEQSVNVALSIADRAYVMEKGEIGFSGDAADLRDQPDLLRAAYLEGLGQALDSR